MPFADDSQTQGFFSNRVGGGWGWGAVTLRLMIRSGQFSNLSVISSMSALFCKSETSNQNRMSYTDDKVKQKPFQQLRVCNPKINDPIWPVLELVRDFIHIHLQVSGTSDQN